MNYSQFLAVFPRSEPSKVYLFAGPELYWHRQGRREILNRFVPEAARELNYARYGDSAEDLQRGLSLALTRPLGWEHRVVVLQGPALAHPDAVQRIELFCRASTTRNILILEMEKTGSRSPKESDKRTARTIEEVVKENGMVIECPLLKPAEKKQWVQEFAKQQGYVMDFTAVSTAAERAGATLSEMANQMEKLFDWAGDRKRISAGDVETVLPPDPDLKLFEISNALAEGNARKALLAVDKLLLEGEFPLVLLAVATGLVRKWVAAREMLREGIPAQTVGKRLEIPDFKLDSLISLVRRLPAEQLREAHDACIQADFLCKFSPVPDRLHLERLILQIAAMVRMATPRSR